MVTGLSRSLLGGDFVPSLILLLPFFFRFGLLCLLPEDVFLPDDVANDVVAFRVQVLLNCTTLPELPL